MAKWQLKIGKKTVEFTPQRVAIYEFEADGALKVRFTSNDSQLARLVTNQNRNTLHGEDLVLASPADAALLPGTRFYGVCKQNRAGVYVFHAEHTFKDESNIRIAYGDKQYYEEVRQHLKTRAISEKYQKLVKTLIQACLKLKDVSIYCYETDLVFIFPEGTDLASPPVQKLRRVLPRLIPIKSIELHGPDNRFGDGGPQIVVSF